jgi:ribosomal protein S18 acetylase RimI-like enzyme
VRADTAADRDVAVEISPVQINDTDALVALWHAGWHDAHAHLVPAAILSYRTPEHFRLWLGQSGETIFVARGACPLGFVSVRDGELCKLYIAPTARGTGIAVKLMTHAEQRIRSNGYTEAELLCLDGNLRAQRFYEREGWRLAESFPEALWLPEAETARYLVPTRRYRKAISLGLPD